MFLVLTKNCKVIYHLESSDLKEIRKEYKRITRNAWRRKYAFNQVEFPQDLRMSWYEVPKRGDDISITGHHRFYLEVRERF